MGTCFNDFFFSFVQGFIRKEKKRNKNSFFLYSQNKKKSDIIKVNTFQSITSNRLTIIYFVRSKENIFISIFGYLPLKSDKLIIQKENKVSFELSEYTFLSMKSAIGVRLYVSPSNYLDST